MKERWGIHVCTCEGKLPLDGARMAQLAPFVDVGAHPRSSAAPLAQKAREADVNCLLVACCQGVAPFRAAADAQRFSPALTAVDHQGRGFLTSADPAEANGKVLRLLRAELRAAQRREPAGEVALSAGKRVVLFTDLAAGLTLAETLSETLSVTTIVDPGLELPPGFPARRVRRGRLVGVQGRLGAFITHTGVTRTAVTRTAADRGATGNGGGAAEGTVGGTGGSTVGGTAGSTAGGSAAAQESASDQVVLVVQQPPAVKVRTGLHVLVNPAAALLRTVPALLQETVGEFMKPVSVKYDESVCAGGAAGQQACGLCIPACPYGAIGRDGANPLRIRVDQLACEACGACAAACPTSALAFTEPNAGELLGRLAGWLGPAAGPPEAPLGVVFHCSQQGRLTLDAAAARRRAYSARLLPLEVPCLRHVSDALLLAAFRMGAGGAALLGCETCPHGERALLELNSGTAERVLAAAGLGAGRIRLITARDGSARPEDALEQLDEFAAGLRPNAVRFAADRYHPAGNRELVADALRALVAQYGPKEEPVRLPRGAPYARAEVRAEGCTLCRSCVNVCPTHAFRYDERQQSLEFKQVACVACGLCEGVCPEDVITLRPELALTEAALDYRVLVRDELVACTRCRKPFVGKRALAAVEARVRAAPVLAGVFEGERSGLLRMCPDCRAVAATLQVQRGWNP